MESRASKPRLITRGRDALALTLLLAALLYLALILVTYTRTDPGFSFTGTGAPIVLPERPVEQVPDDRHEIEPGGSKRLATA